MSGGTVSTYAIASGANQISTITTGSSVRTFGYLASGQVSGDQRTATSDYTFAYNNDGRMQTASLNSSGVGSYVYNGFEQRAQKTVGSAVTDFIFDRFGHLLAEANDATGAMLREYIWLDNRPVAMVDDTGASPVVYYVHTDQLGTPQKITDGSADVVWDGVFDPFGNMVTSTGANWGTGVWLSFTWEPTTPQTMPLRFPGQYADSETALNQNWNRDYDPTVGRYIESDPIGLDSGINTYTYAMNNPLSYSDLSGTDPFGFAIGGPWGGLLGDLLQLYLNAATSSGVCYKSPKQCEIQYDNDSEICRYLPTNGARGRCWESAAERQAHCIQTNGEVGWPPLITQ
jgi:RHS repeat-associated protein